MDIKNEGCKCDLGNKEQKAMFLVVSRSDVQLGYEHPFLRARSGAQVKLRAQKIGRLERNLSTPVFEKIMYKQMATFMNKYFFKFQCGFRKWYSTQQCLIALIEKWKSAVDSGKSFGVLLIDLQKLLIVFLTNCF